MRAEGFTTPQTWGERRGVGNGKKIPSMGRKEKKGKKDWSGK